MAKAISSEELQLRKRARRRLVGAIALVLVVVVFLPMMLDNEPKPISQDIAISIPPAEGGDEEAASAESLRFRPIEPLSEDDDADASDSREQAPPRELPEPVVRNEPIKPAASASKPASAKDEFVVQLGAFSDAGNATKLAATVRDNRFEAYTEVVSTTNGKRTRVRVGPYPTRAAAEEARERLKARKLTYGEPVIMRSTD